MNTKNIIGIIVIVLVLIVGGMFMFGSNSSTYTLPPAPQEALNQTTSSTTSTTSTTASTTVSKTSYTLADVAAHATQASCWTTINNEVYDVTTWISRHPGGAQAITSLCGKDGSAAFTGKHGGQQRPVSELANFRIGSLK